MPPLNLRLPLFPHALSLAMVALAGVACDRLRTPPPAVAPAPVPPPEWRWDAHPLSDRLSLAEVQAVVRPRHEAVLPMPAEGWLYVLDGAPQYEVKAGQPLAFAVEETTALAEAAEKLRLQGVALDDRQRALRSQEARAALAMDEQKVAESLRLLRRAKELQADPAVLEGLLPAGVDPARLDQAIADAESSLKNARDRSAAADQLELDRQALTHLQVENELAKADLERRLWRERAVLAAPFAGQLTRSMELLPLPPGSTARGPGDLVPAGRVRKNIDAPFGVLRDLSELQALAEITDGGFLARPTAALILSFDVAGRHVEAPFQGRLESDIAVVRPPVYRFGVPADDRQLLMPILGGRVEGHLQEKLPVRARLVPKVALVLYRASVFQGGDWTTGVKTVFPGARVLGVGRDVVAIVPPEAP